MTTDDENSLSDEATFAGAKPRPSRDDLSLGDERTLGGGDAAGLDTVIDDIEIVDLEARYTIEGTLGQGGMGAVLLATDTRLGRKVAIKRILGEAARSKTAIMRFLTEAKAIAALNHPNIVQIYDYGRAKDGPYLIMEFVDGGSLADRCKQGAIPLEEAVELACQICDGLAKAHDAGIVHRDIKPANVLLNRDGLPKLTDFGLAKAETADHGMTMTGAVMGTPDFMPPEQRRDVSEVDHRSDLWSLAASVYQMVTGRSPKIIRFNDVPAALQDVLAKALEDRKDSRYQSARELRDALKTGLRAAATAVEELVEGVCPSCGVKNDLSRRFCRGCGESLLAPCLNCSEATPIWEDICGECGAKQTPLAEDRRQAMAKVQAEAEGLLGDFEFEKATAIATGLRDEAHPKLKHLVGWATTFLEQIETSRAEQIQHALQAIAEAGKHEAAYDYLSAAFALDSVPEVLRATALPGSRESVAGMLDRLRKTQAEVQRLESLVKERLASKQVDELLPDVERLLALRPDREDIQKLRSQLLDRQQKQAGARDKAIEAAKASLASYDYEGALASLTGVAAAAVTPDVTKLREQAERLARQVRTLEAITVAQKCLESREYEKALEALGQLPASAETPAIIRLREQVALEESAWLRASSLYRQVKQQFKAGYIVESMKIFSSIPEEYRHKDFKDASAFYSRVGVMRDKALRCISDNTVNKRYVAGLEIGNYRAILEKHGVVDQEFQGAVDEMHLVLRRNYKKRKFFRGLPEIGEVFSARNLLFALIFFSIKGMLLLLRFLHG